MMSDYQEYLEQKHQQNNSPTELINQIVKDATGKIPQTTKKIVAGESNEVYDITLANQENVILRINQSDFPAFRREKWAIEQASKIGVPTPELLLLKEIPKENNQIMSLWVQRKIPGEPLERGAINYGSLNPQLLRRYINQAGEILAKIHSIDVNGFGYLDENGQGEFPTVKALLSEHLGQEKTYFDIAHQQNIDPQILTRVFSLLEKLAATAPDIKPKLNHNDFNPKHIIVSGEKVTGIIDWGEVHGHSPVNEFAQWQFWFSDIPLEWLKEGYTDKSIFDENFDKMIYWIQLHARLGTLWWYSKVGYKPSIDFAVKGLVTAIEYFDKNPPQD